MFLALMLAAAAPAEAEIGGAASVEERQGGTPEMLEAAE